MVNVDLCEYLIKSVLLEPEIGTLWTDCAAMTFYLNKLSRDDIECGKVSYHCSPIFACVFLQIGARCFGNGAKLWIYNPGSSKPYFSLSWDSGLERGGLKIQSFRCLTEAQIISDMYVIIT